MATNQFDPEEFFNLAVDLASGASDEAALRTAVNRAYYAMFLIARDVLGVKTKTGGVHGEVKDKLKGKSRSGSLDLDELFRLRKLADYELDPVDPVDRDWQANWEYAEALADQLLPVLRGLSMPP